MLLQIIIQIDQNKKKLSMLPTFKSARKLVNAQSFKNGEIGISYFAKASFI